MSEDEAAVARAAAALVDAFGRHDVDQYFAAFADDATFLFYATDRLLGSRQEYRQLWSEWEADGFRVLECQSINPRVDLLSHDVAVFTHHVRTEVETGGGQERLAERETIVFRREGDGRWLGVHEHLSPDPTSG
jgi:ketosteroid isomerase-like protein